MNYLYRQNKNPFLKTLNNQVFPIHRIYCVGLNYPETTIMVNQCNVIGSPPIFMKPADAVVESNSVIPYPMATTDLFYEVELVVAIINGGRNIPIEAANNCIFGCAVGLDMTRHDLQEDAINKGFPWDMSKGFDDSAPCSILTPMSNIDLLRTADIELKVNGDVRQHSNLSEMIRSVPEIIHLLSNYVLLMSGDLIYTGTPEGSGSVYIGDKIEASISGLEPLVIHIGDKKYK